MKRLIKKTRGLIKGAPTAVLVSAVLHLILFAVFGGIVVFSVVQKREKKFTPPPPVERPKMELKKPKVKIKKKPRPKAMQRIVSKQVQEMPDLQLPAVSGIGEGLGSGIGGFELIPDPADMTLFGGKKSSSIGNDFEGTFYALGLDRRGRRNGVSEGSYAEVLRKFYDSGWNPRALSAYYRWPQKLYTTFIFIPTMEFEHVPRSFGIPDEVYTAQWMVHYKGKIRSKEGGRFRFWGVGNHVLAIRIDGQEVGFLGIQGLHRVSNNASDWRSSSSMSQKYYSGHLRMVVGDWFELEADQLVEMEVVIGDHNGWYTQAALRIEKHGELYARNRDGAPILPVFKTAEIPQGLKDEIKYLTLEGDQDLDSDLMFNVY